MLKNDFYHIINLQLEAGSITATVQVNAGHAIFAGHFPGQPIVPGACLMQMVREVTEEALNRKLIISKATNLKFITPIDPQQTQQLDVRITYWDTDDHHFSVSAMISAAETVCLKMQAVLRKP